MSDNRFFVLVDGVVRTVAGHCDVSEAQRAADRFTQCCPSWDVRVVELREVHKPAGHVPSDAIMVLRRSYPWLVANARRMCWPDSHLDFLLARANNLKALSCTWALTYDSNGGMQAHSVVALRRKAAAGDVPAADLLAQLEPLVEDQL